MNLQTFPVKQMITNKQLPNEGFNQSQIASILADFASADSKKCSKMDGEAVDQEEITQA